MSVYLSIVFFVMVVFIGFVIFFEKRDPSRTLLWLMLLVFLPGLGFILYLLFGENYKIYQQKKRRSEIDRYLSNRDIQGIINLRRLTQTQTNAIKEDLFFYEEKWKHQRKVMQTILRTDHLPVTFHNTVDIYKDGNEKFKALFEDIKQAKDHIHLEYFILKKSNIGEQLKELLIQKTKEGVKVRFLYDDLGSFRLFFHRDFIQSMRQVGIEVRPYIRVDFPYFHRKFNYRNHRKICIIDGRIGYIGGLNIGDEYLGRDKKIGYWRDTHMRIVGEGVYFLQDQFIIDYYIGRKKALEETNLFPPITQKTGDAIVQMATSGPDSQHDCLYQAYFSAIVGAEKTIYLETPYFIPDFTLLNALRNALYRGVKVKLIFPSFPDHRLVYHASMSYIEDLLKHGGEVFLYKKGFLHSKLLIVDDKIASLGSCNMDIRSFMINFEMNSFLYDQDTITKLVKMFEQDIQDAEKLDLLTFMKRPLIKRFIEAIIRLFSPIL